MLSSMGIEFTAEEKVDLMDAVDSGIISFSRIYPITFFPQRTHFHY